MTDRTARGVLRDVFACDGAWPAPETLQLASLLVGAGAPIAFLPLPPYFARDVTVSCSKPSKTAPELTRLLSFSRRPSPEISICDFLDFVGETIIPRAVFLLA